MLLGDHKIVYTELGGGVHTFVPRTPDAETSISLRDQGQPDLQSESRIVMDIIKKNLALKLIITKKLKNSIH